MRARIIVLSMLVGGCGNGTNGSDGSARDLSSAPIADLAGSPDLTNALDLRDLTPLPDLTSLPDLARPPDMTVRPSGSYG